MEQELIDPSANDPASKAFDRLRREVTTMRLAVEHLADAPGKIEIPDYTTTLEKLARATQVSAAHIEAMSEKPGLQLTPESLSNAISKAGATSRAADHSALTNATTAFQSAEQSITKSLISARTASEQDTRLKKVSINCLIAGMVIWAIVPGPIARALPESWHLPERLAVRAMGSDAWIAGQRLMGFANADEWYAIEATDRATKESRDVIARCYASAKRSRSSRVCPVIVKPTAQRQQRIDALAEQ